MLSYVIRRILFLFPTLIGITIVVFAAISFSPGGISGSLISREGTMRPNERRERKEYITKRYGLHKPFVVQYFRWLNKMSPVRFPTFQDSDPEVIEAVKVAEKAPRDADGDRAIPSPYTGDFKWGRPTLEVPDLGTSFIKGRPVADLIGESLPITLMLNFLSLPVIYVLALVAGVRAAQYRGHAFDVVSGTSFLALWSVPVILAGTLAIGFLTSRDYVRLFPTNGLHDIGAEGFPYLPRRGADGFERGYLLDMMWHLVLPIVCMSYGAFALLSKLARGSVLDNLSAEYARTARAKGLGVKAVLYRHVFRNSLLPLITVAAGILPELIGGAVIVEKIFGINGMGRLAVEATQQKDPELVLTITFIGGLLGLLGNLFADIAYAVADPRVSYDG